MSITELPRYIIENLIFDLLKLSHRKLRWLFSEI